MRRSEEDEKGEGGEEERGCNSHITLLVIVLVLLLVLILKLPLSLSVSKYYDTTTVTVPEKANATIPDSRVCVRYFLLLLIDFGWKGGRGMRNGDRG